jgi:hypothetical protein
MWVHEQDELAAVAEQDHDSHTPASTERHVQRSCPRTRNWCDAPERSFPRALDDHPGLPLGRAYWRLRVRPMTDQAVTFCTYDAKPNRAQVLQPVYLQLARTVASVTESQAGPRGNGRQPLLEVPAGPLRVPGDAVHGDGRGDDHIGELIEEVVL